MKHAPIIVLIILALGVAAVTIYRPHGRPRVHSIGPAVNLASDFSPSVRCLLTRSRLRRLKMDMFDYNAPAELFTGRLRSRTQSVGYRRFARAVDAVRFAIEDLPAQSLAGASLEVGEDRFNAEGIRRLYQHTGYPLDRREPSARTPKGPDAGLEHDPAQRTKSVSWRRP